MAIALALVFVECADVSAQVYRRENRRAIHDFVKGDFDDAMMHYDRALSKDKENDVLLKFNKAYVLHNDRRDSTLNMVNDSLALKCLDEIAEDVVGTQYEYGYHFNKGVIAIDMENWQLAVDEFKKCLLMIPDDMKAKENYIYAKEHLKNQQQNQQNQQDQQDQNGDQEKKDGDQEKKNDDQEKKNDDQEKKNGDQEKKDGDQDEKNGDEGENGDGQESRISPQAAKQILQAVQAKEKVTQEKVEKKKAAAMRSKQKGKNW